MVSASDLCGTRKPVRPVPGAQRRLPIPGIDGEVGEPFPQVCPERPVQTPVQRNLLTDTGHLAESLWREPVPARLRLVHRREMYGVLSALSGRAGASRD